MVGRREKPFEEQKTSRSRAWFPIATAGRRLLDAALDMMPNGMLAREKCDCGGMGNQDLIGMLSPCCWYSTFFRASEVQAMT